MNKAKQQNYYTLLIFTAILAIPSSEIATSISHALTDSNKDQSNNEVSAELQLPLPKQPHIKASVVVDVADLAGRSSLSDSEKYDFYCNHFTPDIDYKFPRSEGGRSFL